MTDLPDHNKSFSLHAMALDWSPDWTAIFGREARIILEIGFGNGIFLEGLSRKHPDANIVGVERAHVPLHWTEKRVQQEKLSNVRLVAADGLMALSCLFEPESISEAHMNFSDPWHKRKHHQRRLVNDKLLAVLGSRTKPGGLIYIATDITPYAEEIHTSLNRTPGIENAFPEKWMHQREDSSIVTHYEKKAVQAGRTCYYFKYRRSDAPIAHPPSVKELTPMPNTLLHLPYSLQNIVDSFERRIIQHDDRLVKILAVYQQPGAEKLLFEVLVQEPLFDQRFMVTLSRRDTAENEKAYLLQMGSTGYPRATRGVHDAVYDLMEWLLALDPAAKIINSTVLAPK